MTNIFQEGQDRHMGEKYAELQNNLAQKWATHGPEAVLNDLQYWDRDNLLNLVMLNIGRDATRS